MHDVMGKGITLVESLEKRRQPLTHLEAIYIMVPTDITIQALIDDFDREPRYKAIHVFFLEKCSTSLFSKLSSSRAAKRIHTLQEANMAFLPYESKVFTLDYPQAFSDFYSQVSIGQGEMYQRIADQLATVCSMLGEYPAVRYRNEVGRTVDIAEAVQARLDSYKADKRDLGSGPEKYRSQLIILDRGFDVITPILHELTFQAMVYDTLEIRNDVYSYRTTSGAGDQRQKKVILDENDELWRELRHEHIADVSKVVYEKFQAFATKKKLKHPGDPDISIKDLGRHIRRVPQYQKELSGYSLHLNLVEKCLQKYRSGINDLCKVEQDLATGQDAQGDPITDPMKIMMPCLFDRKVGVTDKVRLLMLYILFKGGLSREDFAKLMQHSEIPVSERKLIVNLMHLGCNILNEDRVKTPKHKLKRKERLGEKYEVSRWTPAVQDIAEYAITETLDEGYCPYLRGKPRPSSMAAMTSSTTSAPGTSVRQRWNWIPSQKPDAKEAPQAKKEGPTIIIFIVGGMTYSEMRAVYEVAKASSTHDVIIGSTSIISPGDFLGDLQELRPMVQF